jgi:hypothetical protein
MRQALPTTNLLLLLLAQAALLKPLLTAYNNISSDAQ